MTKTTSDNNSKAQAQDIINFLHSYKKDVKFEPLLELLRRGRGHTKDNTESNATFFADVIITACEMEKYTAQDIQNLSRSIATFTPEEVKTAVNTELEKYRKNNSNDKNYTAKISTSIFALNDSTKNATKRTSSTSSSTATDRLSSNESTPKKTAGISKSNSYLNISDFIEINENKNDEGKRMSNEEQAIANQLTWDAEGLPTPGRPARKTAVKNDLQQKTHDEHIDNDFIRSHTSDIDSPSNISLHESDVDAIPSKNKSDKKNTQTISENKDDNNSNKTPATNTKKRGIISRLWSACMGKGK